MFSAPINAAARSAGAPPLVQKYGGSSLASVERIHGVADRVAATHRAGRALAVVVSAMGRRTDELLTLARSVSPTPHARELDALLSTGEAVSTALLAMALRDRGIDAVSLRGWQAEIRTEGRHGHARIADVSPQPVRAELAAGRVAVVTGYQGVGPDKTVTTLGRGGSDYSAVALAASLSAVRCEIYSDVEGVYSADPRVVPDARPIPHLGYDEMYAFSRQGAKVLNADAVAAASDQRVIVYAGSTFGGHRFTVVGPTGRGPAVVGVTGRASVFRLRGRPDDVERVAREHDEVGRCDRGEDLEVVLKLRETTSAAELARAPLALEGPFASVAIVGRAVTSPSCRDTMRRTVGRRALTGTVYTGRCSLAMLVANEDGAAAARRLHAVFVDRPRASGEARA
ncbi:MAG: aspartate kinase [Sandaracinaceae bacterium]